MHFHTLQYMTTDVTNWTELHTEHEDLDKQLRELIFQDICVLHYVDWRSLCTGICGYNGYNHLSPVLRQLPEMFAKSNLCTAEALIHGWLIKHSWKLSFYILSLSSFNFMSTVCSFLLFFHTMFSTCSIELVVMPLILLVILGCKRNVANYWAGLLYGKTEFTGFLHQCGEVTWCCSQHKIYFRVVLHATASLHV